MSGRQLKIFYWDSLEHVRRAFATAVSKEQAIELVIDDLREYLEARGDPSTERLEALRAELGEKRCHIHYKPVGFAVIS